MMGKSIRTRYAFYSTTRISSIAESKLVLPNFTFPSFISTYAAISITSSSFLRSFSALSFCPLYLCLFHCGSRSSVYICSLHVQTSPGCFSIHFNRRTSLPRTRGGPRLILLLKALLKELHPRIYRCRRYFLLRDGPPDTEEIKAMNQVPQSRHRNIRTVK